MTKEFSEFEAIALSDEFGSRLDALFEEAKSRARSEKGAELTSSNEEGIYSRMYALELIREYHAWVNAG